MKKYSFFSLLLLISSCGDFKIKNWEPHLLGPIAKMEMSIGDGTEYTIPYEFREGATIRLGNLATNISNAFTLLSVPNVEITLGNVGPFRSLESNTTAEAEMKTAQIEVIVENKTGVVIVRNSRILVIIPTLSVPLISVTLNEDIFPQQKKTIASVTIDSAYKSTKLGGVQTILLKDFLSVSFENLRVASTSQPVNANQSVELEIAVSNPTFKSITLKPEANEEVFTASDKVEVNFSGGETGVENIKDSLIIFMFNQTPITLYPQIYLYEKETDNIPLDSLFAPTASGRFAVLGNTSRDTETRYAISVRTYFDKLKKAKYMKGSTGIRFLTNSPNDRIRITDSQIVGFRVVIDSRISVSN
ncbi:MAG: hypothetical protein NZM38_01360 [Cytophagales bacterium]|nr:hypothetical protein [Cytophagales bacterium]MDW8383398.1 hypothetical protein [Flammeovirgaceae bacterium]